jgi:hypothetical protein
MYIMALYFAKIYILNVNEWRTFHSDVGHINQIILQEYQQYQSVVEEVNATNKLP